MNLRGRGTNKMRLNKKLPVTGTVGAKFMTDFENCKIILSSRLNMSGAVTIAGLNAEICRYKKLDPHLFQYETLNQAIFVTFD